ncbi:beta-ketoacyl synthase chain length factor [Enterovibrio sp. ZSDZ42]|uniref:Beta-ketoacyl synthase chain length factor n=1 Tax=Enterovibrio gelatinilyticus TaxID=2899819 RepID=A0ABT5QV35_9GAMM|nr:beta-ketoacyl synthase chain length factor [Enterovibrio sp. ZSDZ42]MDD1791866.1 beta-ketoacyl synthase chain length factor [Enterovibrio sp. ZSDZ42]
MSSIQFNLRKLNALSPGLVNQEDWTNWSHLDYQWPEGENTPPASAIPAMMRRRMSAISKLAVQIATELIEHESVDFVVFSSRHGELQRTITLLNEIQAGQDASPTAFSQSVHNTAAGLFTIATKQAIPATSLSGGEDSFHYALTEAAIYLTENPKHKVLVVDFDAPLPEPYTPFNQYHVPPYAFGVIIEHGEQFTVSRSSASRHDATLLLPQALAFYANVMNAAPTFVIQSSRQHWEWCTKGTWNVDSNQ